MNTHTYWAAADNSWMCLQQQDRLCWLWISFHLWSEKPEDSLVQCFYHPLDSHHLSRKPHAVSRLLKCKFWKHHMGGRYQHISDIKARGVDECFILQVSRWAGPRGAMLWSELVDNKLITKEYLTPTRVGAEASFSHPTWQDISWTALNERETARGGGRGKLKLNIIVFLLSKYCNIQQPQRVLWQQLHTNDFPCSAVFTRKPSSCRRVNPWSAALCSPTPKHLYWELTSEIYHPWIPFSPSLCEQSCQLWCTMNYSRSVYVSVCTVC